MKKTRATISTALARASWRPCRRNHIVDGLNLPRHIVDRFERRWAQKIEAQVHAWKPAKLGDRIMNDQEVPVVHRRRRPKLTKEAAA